MSSNLQTIRLYDESLSFSYMYKTIYQVNNPNVLSVNINNEKLLKEKKLFFFINNEIDNEEEFKNISIGNNFLGQSLGQFRLPIRGKFSIGNLIKGALIFMNQTFIYSQCRFFNGLNDVITTVNPESWGTYPPPAPEKNEREQTLKIISLKEPIIEITPDQGIFHTSTGELWKFGNVFIFKTTVINVTRNNSKFFIVFNNTGGKPSFNDLPNANEYKLFFDTSNNTIKFYDKNKNIYNFSGNPTITKTGTYNITIRMQRKDIVKDENGIDVSGVNFNISLETVINTGYYGGRGDSLNIFDRRDILGGVTKGYDSSYNLIRLYYTNGDEILWNESRLRLGDIHNVSGKLLNGLNVHGMGFGTIPTDAGFNISRLYLNDTFDGTDFSGNEKTWIIRHSPFGKVINSTTKYHDINFDAELWDEGYMIWLGADVSGSKWNNQTGIVFNNTEITIK